MTVQLEFNNVLLGYGGKPVLPPLQFAVNKGDFLGIVGPNGAGKTTVLKALLGIIKPLSGRISVHGTLRFGYVPQQEVLDELFPLSARDIVAMARHSVRKLPGGASRGDREAVDNALKRVELYDKADLLYRELSGGQKQRTLIARALAADPRILVLDEPTNGMDILAESSLMEIIDTLNRQGLTTIMVSHMLTLVARHATTIMLINKEIFQGSAQEILTENTLSQAYGGQVRITSDNHQRQIIYVDTNNGRENDAGNV
jgi:ABC-type Mn2+/Zn2+ transport system ATPase subunit